jgi:acyl-coenzyme A thioesterase 13
MTALEVISSFTGREFSGSPSPFTHWLKPVVVSAAQGEMVFRYTVRKEMTNPIDILHGGVTAAIMDDIIGVTMYSFNESKFYTTLNNVIDYFSTAVEGETVTAETRVIKKGSRVANVQCEIWNHDHTKLIARGYSNLLRIDGPKPR